MIDNQRIKNVLNKELNEGQYRIPPTPYHAHTGLDSPKILFSNLENAPNAFCVAKTTNGTTAVNVFTSKGAPFNFSVTGMFLISNDTTAGNVTLKNNGTAVAVVAKGVTAGAMVGATSLSYGTYVSGTSFTVESSSVGNSTVFVTFLPF